MKAFHTTCKLTFIGLCLAAANGAYAQVGSINSVFISHVFNDMPGATVTPVNSYPGSVSLGESGVTRPASGGLNRDVWQFSNNGGASAYQFQNNDYFNASFSLTLTGSGTSGVDLEAGWLLSNPSGGFGGDLQSIVTAAGVVVQFGGPSYYPFSPAAGGYPGAGGSVPNYVLGQTFIMGMNYVIDPNTGLNAFQYSVNGQYAASSPGDTYFDLGPGVGLGSIGGNPLGGYFQIGNDPNNPNNNGTALFGNINITSATPEPATLALLGLGIVPLLLRRFRK
jgi:PEP-CTERM motif